MLGIYLSLPPLFKIAVTVLYLATDRVSNVQKDCFLSCREYFMESSWSSCYYRMIYSSLNSEVYYRAVGDHEHDGPSPKEACRAEVRTIAAHNPL